MILCGLTTLPILSSNKSIQEPFTLVWWIDNFQVQIESQPILEPTTIALMGFGLLGLADMSLGSVGRKRVEDYENRIDNHYATRLHFAMFGRTYGR